MNKRFGWHSGTITCRDAVIKNDMTIEGDMSFGDASTDTLTVAGAATFESTIAFESTLTRGVIGTAEDVTMVDNIVPIQVNVNASAGNVSKTLAAAYLKTGISTMDLSSVQACGVLARVSLKYDCESAYGVQSHVGIDADMATGVSHANIAAISGKIDMDNDITQGNAQAGLFIMEGTGTITEESTCIQACAENGTTIGSMMVLSGSGTATNVFSVTAANRTNFIDFASAAGCVATAGGESMTVTHKIKLLIGSDTVYLQAGTMA
jgi:hypothetical protein